MDSNKSRPPNGRRWRGQSKTGTNQKEESAVWALGSQVRYDKSDGKKIRQDTLERYVARPTRTSTLPSGGALSKQRLADGMDGTSSS